MKLTITIPKTESLTLTKSMAMKVNMFVSGIRYVPGPPGEDGLGFTFKGKWDEITYYYINDVVAEPIGGNLYIAIADNLNSPLFDIRNWAFYLPKGYKGDQGEPPDDCVISTEVSIIKKLTQAEYDVINPKIHTTLYIII
jgi:hypothetical protein